jgi:hypothetical protein
MAEITAYPLGTPATDTLLVGTQMNVPQSDGTKANLTRNFPISQISTLITQDYVEVTKTISNAEWLALPTTSVVLIPAQGAGTAIKILAATLKFNYATSSFFFPNNLTIGSGTAGTNGNGQQCFLLGDSGSGGFDDIDGDTTISLATKNAIINLNAPIYLGKSTGTIGGGTVDVILRYQVI